MLARFPSTGESHESPPVPLNLRTLAEALLTRNHQGTTASLENMLIEELFKGSIRGDDFVPGSVRAVEVDRSLSPRIWLRQGYWIDKDSFKALNTKTVVIGAPTEWLSKRD